MEFIDLFESRAQSRLLQVLAQNSESIPFRQLADVSEVPLFSAQLAIKHLLKQKIIVEKRVANLRLIQLNPRTPFYELLREVFKITKEFQIKENAKNYQKRAAKVLDFTQSALDLINQARKSKK